MNQEIRKRQQFLTQTATADEQIKNMHNVLSDSLNAVSREPFLDGVLLDYETRRLNESLNGFIHEQPTRHRSPTRRSFSPSKYKSLSRFN